MRIRFSFCVYWLVLLAFWLLPSCGSKETPGAKETDFLVNSRTGDSSLTPSADVQTLRFMVVSVQSWTVVQEGLPADWVVLEKKKTSMQNTWEVTLSLTENLGSEPRQTVWVFTSGELKRRVTVIQSTEDVIFRTSCLGAYGVPGGDIVQDSDAVLFSRLHFGETGLVFRLMDLDTHTMASLSGLSRPLEVGQRFTVLYRMSEHGLTRVTESYELQVIRIRDQIVWLKKDEQIYFIVKQ